MQMFDFPAAIFDNFWKKWEVASTLLCNFFQNVNFARTTSENPNWQKFQPKRVITVFGRKDIWVKNVVGFLDEVIGNFWFPCFSHAEKRIISFFFNYAKRRTFRVLVWILALVFGNLRAKSNKLMNECPRGLINYP